MTIKEPLLKRMKKTYEPRRKYIRLIEDELNTLNYLAGSYKYGWSEDKKKNERELLQSRGVLSYHAPNADRYKVSSEVLFSALRNRLHSEDSTAVSSITKLVDEYLQIKTAKRLAEGKDKLPDYYRDFALLQEITKVACKKVCSELTVAHTSRVLSEYSVSSFYRVGLDLGLIDSSEIVPFPPDTNIDG